ncbi:MAG: flagellar hook-basal body protein [Firmicutes bacterium]|nr:flagellar hook-basal body protein [Bacillota bacterium]
MLKAIGQCYSGIRAHQQLLDVTAHNIANVNTVAFKGKQVSFQELTYREIAQRRLPRAGNPAVPPRSGRGTAVVSTAHLLEQGSPAYTGRSLDLAIMGEGFFRVIRPDGSYAYTRGGNFSLDAEGNLTLPGGIRLDPVLNLRERENEIDLSTLSISPDGAVLARPYPEGGGEILFRDEEELAGGMIKLGEIQLYRFINPESLLNAGENLFVPSETSGPPAAGIPGENGFGTLQQYYLENSNVDLAQEITGLIRGQRALQSSSRTLTTADELWALTLNMQS